MSPMRSSQTVLGPPDPDRVSMIDVGAGPGAPVLVLHGWTGSKEDFSAIIPTLPGHRIVVPDLPGHGGTPAVGPPDAHGLDRLAPWVLGLADRLGVGDFHLIGHSLGGLLAQHVAQLGAHRVRSLCLIGTGLGAVNEETADRIVRIATTARDHGLTAAWDVVIQDGDASADPRAAFVRDRFLSMSVDALVGGAHALVNTAPLGAFLRGMDFPVLVCHGEGDQSWLPHEQRLLARTITGAAYSVIPDALHSPAVENPSGLLDILRPFLTRAENVTAMAGSTRHPHQPGGRHGAAMSTM